MIIFILTFLWVLSAMVEGFIQAHYYDAIPEDTKGHINIHPFYVILRSLLLGLMGYEVLMVSDFKLAFVFIFIQCCIFSFFHNGVYYKTRNWLNPKIYKKGFCDASETSKAVIELGFGIRTSLAIIGFVGLVMTYLEFKNY